MISQLLKGFNYMMFNTVGSYSQHIGNFLVSTVLKITLLENKLRSFWHTFDDIAHFFDTLIHSHPIIIIFLS